MTVSANTAPNKTERATKQIYSVIHYEKTRNGHQDIRLKQQAEEQKEKTGQLPSLGERTRDTTSKYGVYDNGHGANESDADEYDGPRKELLSHPGVPGGCPRRGFASDVHPRSTHVVL